MCVHIAIIATIQAMMLQRGDSAAVLKWNGYKSNFPLTEHLKKAVYTGGGAWNTNVWGSVAYSVGDCTLRVPVSFNLSLKATNQISQKSRLIGH